MINHKTAVELFDENIKKLYLEHSICPIPFYKFEERYNNILNKTLGFEKREIEEAYKQGQIDLINSIKANDGKEYFINHYNK